MKKLVAIAVLGVLFAGLVNAAVIIEWKPPSSTASATTVMSPLVVGDLKINGITPIPALDYNTNGWLTGYNYVFTLTVPAGNKVTFTDWVASNLGWGDNVKPIATVSIAGNLTASLGSGTFTQGGGIDTLHTVAVNPADVSLLAGNYTVTLNLHDPNTQNGAWMKFDGLTLNGTVEQLAAPVPEPATLALVTLGLLGVCFSRKA